MTMPRPLRSGFLLLLALGFGLGLGLEGCASVGVHPTASHEAPPGTTARRPDHIYAAPFDFDRCFIRVDREGAELTAFKKQLASDLSYDIAERLLALGVTGQAGSPGPAVLPTLESGWLIRGHFTRVNQGSRGLRTLIGFGSGGTKMETTVEVYDLSVSKADPIFTFITSGGSGAGPGSILSSNPYTFIAGTATGAVAGISNDRNRTARMIAAYLSEQLARRGWLDWSRVQEAKRLDTEDSAKLQGDEPETETRGGPGVPTATRPKASGWKSR